CVATFPLNAIPGKKHNGGGAKFESAHLVALGKYWRILRVVCGFNGAAYRSHFTSPQGFNARHYHGAHQYYSHGPNICIKNGNQSFVARKKSRHLVGSGRVDGKKITGNGDHLPQLSAVRHMHPVIIPGGKINSSKVALCKLLGQSRIAAEQLLCCVTLSLGLKNAAIDNFAQLTDSAIR